MSYVSQNFSPGQKLRASQMKHIEAGIATADANATKALDIAQKDHATLPPEIAGKADNWMIEEETGLAYLTSGGKKISSGIMIPNDGSGVGGSGSAGTPYAVQYVFQKLTDEQKEQAQNNIGVNPSVYMVDLKKYNIVQMESHAAPFTNKEYEIANNNVLGLNAAFADAHEKGFRRVVIPYGVFPVLYQNTDDDRFSNTKYYSIKLRNDTEYDFSFGKMWVMFDSDNPNPYYSYSDANYYNNTGIVIGLSRHKNITIRNLTLTGERELRSYANASEKNVENTTGICVIDESYNVRIIDVVLESFMADGFSMVTAYGNTGITKNNYSGFTKGYLNLSNGAVTQNSSYTTVVTEYLDISMLAGQYANIWSGIAYQYVLATKPTMIVSFYDSEKTWISYTHVTQCYPFYVPAGAKYIVIEFIDFFNVGITTQSFRITNLTSGNFLLENVVVRNNCRGGVSNVPNFTTFRKCKFYHNGKPSYGGAPAFGLSTGYGIDIEDIQSAGLVLDDCDSYDNDGGILLGAIDCSISNSRIEALTLYRGVSYNITNSTIYGVRTDTASDVWSEAKFFPHVSNSTIIVNSFLTTDLSVFSNCDVIILAGNVCGTSNNNRLWFRQVSSAITGNVKDSLTVLGTVYDIPETVGVSIFGASPALSHLRWYQTGKSIRTKKLQNVTVDYDSLTLTSQNKTLMEVTNCVINSKTQIMLRVNTAVSDTVGDTFTLKECEINTPKLDFYSTPKSVVFKNCVINIGDVTADGKWIAANFAFPVRFENCTFINNTNYNWTVCADNVSSYVTFDGCTFTGFTPYPSYVAAE